MRGRGSLAKLAVRNLRPWLLPDWWDQNQVRAGAFWEMHSQRLRFGAVRRFGQLRPLCVHAAGARGTPIAQCLAQRVGGIWVIEQLVLCNDSSLGSDPSAWTDAMHAVLAHLGPGSYRYGHNWSLEPSREAELASLGGVTVGKVQPVTVHAIENANWQSDADWLAGISTNVKRNLKRARAAEVPVATRWCCGRTSLRNLSASIAMRDVTLRRLGSPTRQTTALIRRGLAWLIGPEGLRVGIASAGTCILAALVGYEVGANFYYSIGGSVPDNNGASWTLLVEAVTDWRRKHPAGRFVLGYLDETLEGVQREGLLRQRQSLRKSDFPTALIRFEYNP